MTWSWIGSEAGGDLVLIQTLLLLICKCKLVSIRTAWSTYEKQWGLYQNKVTPASLPIQDQATKHTTVKWAILLSEIFYTSHRLFADHIRKSCLILSRAIQLWGHAVVQRPDNFILWISHYPTVSMCAKISVFSLVQANMHTLTRVKFGSVRKPWTTFNVKYILGPV